MKTRERMLAAMSRKEVDYVPCCFEFEYSPVAPGYAYKDQFERVKVMQKLGLDPFFQIEPCWKGHIDKTRKTYPVKMHPDVKTRVWEEHPAGEPYPLLHKEYLTPAGKLTCTIKKSEDWPYGQEIPLITDFNSARYVKPLIVDSEDVKKLPYLFKLPDAKDRDEWANILKDIKSRINPEEVIMRGYCGNGMDSFILLCGPERAITLVMDEPETAKRILEITHKYDMEYQKILLELGIDYIERSGWYESTDLWSPRIYREFAMNNLIEEINLVHKAGSKFVYAMCTGIMPLLPFIKQLDFDCLFNAEPVLCNQDMNLIAKELGNKKSIWGGLSAPIHIGEGTPEKVRQAVRQAFEHFGKTGFILSPVPSVRPEWPWKNLMAMIDEWKKLR